MPKAPSHGWQAEEVELRLDLGHLANLLPEVMVRAKMRAWSKESNAWIIDASAQSNGSAEEEQASKEVSL